MRTTLNVLANLMIWIPLAIMYVSYGAYFFLLVCDPASRLPFLVCCAIFGSLCGGIGLQLWLAKVKRKV